MSENQEVIGEIRLINRLGQPRYWVKTNGQLIEAVPNICHKKPLEVHLGWLVRVMLRKGEAGIITAVVRKT